MVNERARKILFDTYWSTTGWKKRPSTPPGDLSYAISEGYMFEPRVYSHDALVSWITAYVARVAVRDVTNAFLASLSTRRLELRSTLGSYAVALRMPTHTLDGDVCEVCGEYDLGGDLTDLSILSFERYKWGGVRHTELAYIGFDLSQFSEQEKVVPVQADLDIFAKILEIVRHCEPGAKPRDLEKRFSAAMGSNKAEREQLIEILAYCGILQPKTHKGFFEAFIPTSQRRMPSVSKLDWNYPICWWRGSDGLNEEALSYYFPQFAAV